MCMKLQGCFNINFLDFPTTESNKKSQFQNYFLEYTPNKWEVGSGGASFTYFDSNNKKYSLVVIQDPRYGFCLMYSPSSNGCYSLGNIDLLGEFVESCDEIVMPLGTYLSPKTAWLAVEDFLDNPYVASNRISWISDDDIPNLDDW